MPDRDASARFPANDRRHRLASFRRRLTEPSADVAWNVAWNVARERRQRLADGIPYHPFCHEGASKNERELPGGVEQAIARRGIGRELLEPPPDQGKVGYDPAGRREPVGDFAEPI